MIHGATYWSNVAWALSHCKWVAHFYLDILDQSWVCVLHLVARWQQHFQKFPSNIARKVTQCIISLTMKTFVNSNTEAVCTCAQTPLCLFRVYIPGWHQVVVVEHLHKGLDLGPLGNLLLAHGCGDFTRITVNACDQSVAVRTVRGAIVNVLNGERAQHC